MPQSPKPARAAKPAGTKVRVDHGRLKLTHTTGHRWSDEAEAVFLDALATSCNVTTASAAAGFSDAAVYARRRNHAAFATKWQAALDQGYARLELALVESAVDSMKGVEFEADRPLPKMTVAEAINVFRIHARNVGRAGPRWGTRAPDRPLEELRVSIMAKVEAIRRNVPALPAPEAAADD